MKIDFYYFEDCPSHDEALALLNSAMLEAKVKAEIRIHLVETDEEAHEHQFYGSPTIKVNGKDIAPLPEGMDYPALTCRGYRMANGRISPLPPRELILAALQS